MKKNWKQYFDRAILYLVISMLLIFCAFGVLLSFSFVVAMIFGIEALTEQVMMAIAILSPFVIFVLLRFAFRAVTKMEGDVRDEL